MNLKVEVTLRLDLNVPHEAAATPELIAELTKEAAEGMIDALAAVRGVSKAAPVVVALGHWHATNDDGTFVGRSG